MSLQYHLIVVQAFIKNMFTSELEVAKFESATLRTVSGIRGSIKKAVKGEKGNFRASFEDKLLLSDIVFCRCWVPIEPREFYNPVTSLLFDQAVGDSWHTSGAAMRPVGKIRFEEGLRAPLLKDSLYKKEEERIQKSRESRKFNALQISAKLQNALPHKSKPKGMRPSNKHKKRSNNGKFLKRKAGRAVTLSLLEPEEREKITLMQKVNTIRHEKVKKRRKKQAEKRTEKAKIDMQVKLKFVQRTNEDRKRKFRSEGKANLRMKNKRAK